jgi:fatty acid desaturase
MQYQLEHHLFPTMPRYNYPKVRPLVKAFAEENDQPFKVSSVLDILQLNYNVIKRYSEENKRASMVPLPPKEANGPKVSGK